MAQLTVRNVDKALVAALKARAQAAGRSAEAEHRMILREALGEGGAEDAFFDRAAARRLRLRAPADTTALLRADRDAR